MSSQGLRSVKGQIIILVVMFTAFAPLTISWYITLDSLDCRNTGLETGHVASDPLSSRQVQQHSCYSNMGWHWVAFYGINGLIFGIPVFALVKTANKNRRWDEELR